MAFVYQHARELRPILCCGALISHQRCREDEHDDRSGCYYDPSVYADLCIDLAHPTGANLVEDVRVYPIVRKRPTLEGILAGTRRQVNALRFSLSA